MKTKTKNKLLTAIVLCTLFLVALPGIGIAAAQADEILDIYGNANEDDAIDMRDFTYTARIILGLEDETTLADADYGGDVNVGDMTQIGLIILGRENELTLVDSADRIVTVNKPVERIVSGHVLESEAITLLGAWDRVVGRDQYTSDEILFQGCTDLPVCTAPMHYDIYYETIFELDPDIFMNWCFYPGYEEVVATLEPEGISVVILDFDDPEMLVENIRKLRYVLNTEESGEAYIEFYEGVVNDITAKTAGLSEDDKPHVFVWPFNYDYQDEYMVYGEYAPGLQTQMEIVGGIDIGKEDVPGFCPYVSSEWLADQDIDVIVGHVSPWVVPGIFAYDVTDPTVAQDTIDWVMDADENPALELSDAVQNERVYLYQNELAGSPRYVVALAYMAKWFHPELFGDDFDPHEIHMTYLTDYMDIDLSEVEDSILFWPEP